MLIKNIKSVCKNLGWDARCNFPYIDISKRTPYGEYFVATFHFQGDLLLKELDAYIKSFDADAHAVEWYQLNHGDLRALLDDAEGTLDELCILHDALEAVDDPYTKEE